MRISFLVLLLATAAPAFAVQRTPEQRADERAERREAAREMRAQRAERSSDDQRPVRAERRQSEERSVDREERRRPTFERVVREPRGDRPQRVDPAVRDVEREARGDTVREWRRRDREAPGRPTLVEQGDQPQPERMQDWRQRQLERYGRRGDADGRNPPAISRVPREGTQPPPPQSRVAHRGGDRRWDGRWRDDRRYDWRRYRDRNRSRFSIGIYIDPFGWRYRPYSVGWRMWPHHYRSNYWLSDPWSYRLPYAPAGYRWIRYYNDAVLVDTWDGQVVDVIRNFFW